MGTSSTQWDSGEVDTDLLENDIADFGLLLTRFDEALAVIPKIGANETGLQKLRAVREAMAGRKIAMLAELRQLKTPDA